MGRDNQLWRFGNRLSDKAISTLPVIRVDSKVYHSFPNWRELWQFREMLYFLVSRDIKVRYRQTLLGAAWAIIQPVVTMIVFTVFFSNVAKIPSNNIPYPIFSFAALVPWTFFANGVGLGSDSLVGQAHLVRKIYFPRLYIPLARIMGGLVDFGLSFLVLCILMLLYGYVPTLWSIVLLPFLCLMVIGITLGVSLWLSALNVRYRDVKYLVPFLIQIWLFATPIVYPSSLIDQSARTLYGLNPMVTVVEGFRTALLGSGQLSQLTVVISVAVTLLVLVSGLLFFHRAESIFADVV